ncbi:MAG: sn-glycerol-3-phosphate ABC transporter ATP-binding protein UgpC [Streptosporangiaceae bacterium]|nr:sn-glycerol-3-phosphate ABC transporter ATP-binding protein UgpC [Streptosporangiaceae bacterium]
MAEIELSHVDKVYEGAEAPAVHDLSLRIADGEFMVLVGPSGCGKTTALRIVAGLEDITEGELRIGDRIVNEVPPQGRNISFVFQNYALFPHMTVYDNMAFGLKLAKVNKATRDKRVREAARMLGLEEYLNRKPRALSGGQRQRVAMGRAIVREPQAYLMDEPLSNLDAKLRVSMRTELARLQRDLNVTTIYVTHDQTEAMTMGDRIAIIRKGELQQVGPPTELFGKPQNLFVAEFIGSPSMNLVEARMHAEGDSLYANVAGQQLLIDPRTLSERPALRGYAGKGLIVGIRPQDFEAGGTGTQRRGCQLKAKVELVEALGTETNVHFCVDAPPVITDEVLELAADLGTDEAARFEQRARRGRNEFVARLDPKTQVKVGSTIDLAVDTQQMHFFDTETGKSIR